MRRPHIDDRVKLVGDIKELGLHRGDVGVVLSTWFAPTTAYEVRFIMGDGENASETRALLLAEQIEVESEPAAP